MTYPAPNFLPARREFLCGLLAAAAATPAWADAMGRFAKAKDVKALPDFEFADADDKPAKLSDLKGKVVLINFWATWCAPCVKEMPSLDRLQATVGKDKLVVLPLSLDGASRAKVAPFYETTKLKNLGIWFDKGRVAMKALGVSILPTSILVDAQGRELGRLEGEADWDKPEAIALVSKAIAS
ncbi:MAG TPA: TlpA disulfide reductase family protein [Reyranellaceae bacterium]|nr:TlpA disulfide reductase family protein [Reyranellaceae bacterium]